MIVVYTPAGGEPEQYDPRTLLTSEAALISSTIDMKWPAVRDALTEDDLEAMRAIVWVLKRREQQGLRYGAFDPGVEELSTRYDRREVENWFSNAFTLGLADPDVTPDQIAAALDGVPDQAADPEHARAFLEQCRAEHEKAAEEGKGPDPDPSPAP